MTVSAISAEIRGFYLFDDDQSAKLETHRMAMRGLADLAFNPTEATGDGQGLDRAHLAALFEVLEQNLGNIIGPDKVGHHFLPRSLHPGHRDGSQS